MCGIFGLIKSKNSSLTHTETINNFSDLFLLSESRGKEASGVVSLSKDKLNVIKSPLPASKLIKSKEFKNLLDSTTSDNFACIGHARLVTNGKMEKNENNQPVIKNGVIGIHNGIIVNDKMLWENHPDITREYDVDTEVILALISKYLKTADITKVFSQIFQEIKGTVSLALFFNNSNYLTLATNNGSLYYAKNNNGFYFASEEYILNSFAKRNNLTFNLIEITKLKPNFVLLINTIDLNTTKIDLNKNNTEINIFQNNQTRTINNIKVDNLDKKSKAFTSNNTTLQINLQKIYDENLQKLKNIKRCTKCILPETMPYIEFDNDGVCNYCKNYSKMLIKGKDELKTYVEKFKRTDGKPDCLVALSGGRDSSYGLHFIKKELGLNPISYSYDWGMLTDLGRRNQARMCGALGVEHILISADIPKKRKFIQKNVLAWLKKPDLGTVPLFMAGDKQYFYHLNKLNKLLDLKLSVYSENPLEKTDFKSGFCGVAPKFNIQHVYDFNLLDKAKLAKYYLRHYFKNPSLLNSSVLDTIGAYFSSYFISHQYLYLFQYLKWDEDEINNTLINEYDWELATDTKTTWRIGDGTAAFYNYIYFTVAGFTENDTFRSNQIREDVLTREKALELAYRDNTPRVESLIWYADTVKFDLNNALKTINNIPKLYLK